MADVHFPRTSAPASRALASAGYTHLGELAGVPMRDVLALHGMGPKAIGLLRRAMAEHGWEFAYDDPRVGASVGGLVAIEEGRKPERNANATEPTDVEPAAWISRLPKKRQREDGAALLTLFAEVTGENPVMWGPSIVGFGAVHYTYESGREGDMPRVGFSPRSASNSLYGLSGHEDVLARLGKYRAGAGCIYINKLADVEQDVLRELIALGWRSNAP
ncbi:MAG: DUF1801 domain-containing protein [Cumulibacter sp.]